MAQGRDAQGWRLGFGQYRDGRASLVALDHEAHPRADQRPSRLAPHLQQAQSRAWDLRPIEAKPQVRPPISQSKHPARPGRKEALRTKPYPWAVQDLHLRPLPGRGNSGHIADLGGRSQTRFERVCVTHPHPPFGTVSRSLTGRRLALKLATRAEPPQIASPSPRASWPAIRPMCLGLGHAKVDGGR